MYFIKYDFNLIFLNKGNTFVYLIATSNELVIHITIYFMTIINAQ
jgi:hypothetical protein